MTIVNNLFYFASRSGNALIASKKWLAFIRMYEEEEEKNNGRVFVWANACLFAAYAKATVD